MYRKKPALFLIEHTEYFDIDQEVTVLRERVARKKMNFMRMLEYAEMHGIPVFSGDDNPLSDDYGMTFVEFPGNEFRCRTLKEIRARAPDYVRATLDQSPELSDVVDALRPGSVAVVGGAHLHLSPSRSKEAPYYFEGCLNRSVTLLHYIREFCCTGMDIMIDPRITLQRPLDRELLNERKLYVVGDPDHQRKVWYLKPLTSSALHTH